MDTTTAWICRWARCSLAAPFVLLLAAGCAVHPRGPHGPACAKIESATHVIEYPSYRLTMLKQVAARKELSAHEQTYLVNAIFMGGFSSQVADTLITLIHNPCCLADTRQQIRTKLKFTRMLGKDEQRVIATLEKADQPTTQPTQPSSS
jgi:hypothetical protein